MKVIREVGRMDNWWFAKVAPVLGIAYCAALLYRVPPGAAARSLLLIALAGLCAGSYGHMVNDAFDIEVDRRAGKRNHMARFPVWQRWLYCALAVFLGFAPALFISFSRISLILLAIEFLLPTVYSVPPLRFKEVGPLGVLCDSLGAHLIPSLYVISVMAHVTSDPPQVHSHSAMLFIAFTAAWALCLGLIGILIHEFEDRENDLQSGIRTFATGISFDAVRWPMTAMYLVELAAFIGMTSLLFRLAPLLAVAATIYFVGVATRLKHHWPHYRHYRDESTSIQWWQLTHPFYETYFPFVVAIQYARIHPALVPFPLLMLFVFASTFRERLAELRALPAAITESLVWRGRLDLDAPACAHLRARLLPFLYSRVEVVEPGQNPWSVRLVRPGVALRAGRVYRVKLTVRADKSRRAALGIWQDHSPWDGLGFYEELSLSPGWLKITRDFTASQTDRHGYIGLWLGAEHGSIDVRRCSVHSVGLAYRLGLK